ncbi:phosphodiester glycosidase family protein [Clostridium sporogenes]
MKIWKRIIFFVIFQLVFIMVTFPLYTFYGPFKKVRNVVVTSAMGTGNHRYIAKIFFSDKKINEIMKEDTESLNDNLNINNLNSKSVEIRNVNNDIKRMEINNSKFEGEALIIHDPKRVKVGYSSKLGQVGETTSDMAKRYKAVAAINGGGYSDVSPNGKTGGTGGIPIGIIISKGKVVYPLNKEEYKKRENCVFAIDGEGYVHLEPASVEGLLNKNIKEAISFTPTLVVDGEPHISDNSLAGIHPRTAIGQKADGSIIFLVIDGRKGFKLGASIKDIQNIMLQLGAVNAMCLDGGGSTTMYYNNEVINIPSCVTGERAIPTIVYVES